MAVDQAREIAQYIALDKPTVAEQWIDEIFMSVERLKEFPESGRVVEEIKRSEIREIVHGSFRVIYKIKGNEILVLLVKRDRQKLRKDEVGG